MLLHTVIILSILVGLLLTFSLILLLLLYSRLRHEREDPVQVKEGTGTAKSVLERPERSEPLDTSNVTKGEEVVVFPSPPESGSSYSSMSQMEVGDAIEECRALPRVPSVASVHAFSDDGQPECPCLQPVAISYDAPSHSGHTPSLTTVSVDDFEQGQDDELHPEVRVLVERGSFSKEAVRRMKPVPPKAGTVIPDYNPVLDEARPETMDEYLE
jgi:hypothetical protein